MPIRRCTTAMRGEDAIRRLRTRRHRSLPRAVRRPHRSRALRRARPGLASSLSACPGGLLEALETPHGRARRAGTVRGSRVGARPAPRARRRACGVRDRTRGSIGAGTLVVHLAGGEPLAVRPRCVDARAGGRAVCCTPSASAVPRVSAPTSSPPCVRGWRGTPLRVGAADVAPARTRRRRRRHREDPRADARRATSAAGPARTHRDPERLRRPSPLDWRAWNERSSSRARAPHREVPRLVRRDPRGRTRRHSRRVEAMRRARVEAGPGRPDDHGPRTPGRERSEHRAAR